MSIALFYLLKVSIALTSLYLVFWLFLRKDTFHQLKRFVLLANLLISLTVPVLPVPSLNQIWDVSRHSVQNTTILYIDPSLLTGLQTMPALPKYAEIWMNIAGFIYLAGVVILLTKFGIQLFSIYTHIRNANVIRQESFTVAISDKVTSPFSFFRHLILSPEQYQPDMLSHILTHEQVHISGKHTIDRLISEVYTIFFWFNPFAWLHQRLLVLNLEYIADQAVLNKGFSAKQYQMHLLKLTLPDRHFQLANNFNQSKLLDRIHMMNKPVSPLAFRLKIAFIIPALTGLVALFNGTQAKKAESLLQEMANKSQNFASTQTIQGVSNTQVRTITGIIKDADTDKLLSGVHIQVKGQSTSTKSDANGKFSINVSEKDKALVFQLENFNTTEMAIASQSEMIVLLKLTSDAIARSSPSYLLADTIKIKSSGSDVLNSYSIKDFSANSIEIRGQKLEIRDSSSLSDENILYLIDGKVVDKAQFNKINGDQIATINLYKDKATLQMFEAEDKKGVIAIELKK